MARLSPDVLAGLSADKVRVPAYDRVRTRIGIVHLGIGAFHRAHQALYTEDVLERDGGDWGICGVSLRRGVVRDQMQPQSGLYTAIEKHGDAVRLRVVGAVKEVLVAAENPGAVIARLAWPGVRVVTLTVTEKGYCLGQGGEVDSEHEDICYDLQHPDAPRSAVGFLCAGLARRHRMGLAGLTIISCDNLSQNGPRLRGAVLALATQRDPSLANWISRQCRFPETMVDRIVPSTTADDLETLEHNAGYRDEAAVVGEPFRQWVIQRDFAGAVPAWDTVGADFVDSVAPYEAMKLRLLNASHSIIAYLACLAGWQTVADAIVHPPLYGLIQRLMAVEVQPCLDIPPGFDVARYQQDLLDRFSNSALQHRTRQIAMDGSQKLPQRLLPTLQWQLRRGGPVARLALGLAAWIRFSRLEKPDDPLADAIASIHASTSDDPQDYVPAILALEAMFPRSLADNDPLRDMLIRYAQILAQPDEAGVLAAIAVAEDN